MTSRLMPIEPRIRPFALVKVKVKDLYDCLSFILCLSNLSGSLFHMNNNNRFKEANNCNNHHNKLAPEYRNQAADDQDQSDFFSKNSGLPSALCLESRHLAARDF